MDPAAPPLPPPPPPPPDGAGGEAMVAVPAALFAAMQEALRQQQAQEAAAQQGPAAPPPMAPWQQQQEFIGPPPPQQEPPQQRAPHHPWPQAAAADAEPPVTRQQVEAEMVGLPAAEYPHVAALVASLLKHNVLWGRPRPKNPVSLLHEAANAQALQLEFDCGTLPHGGNGFVATVSAAPNPQAGRRRGGGGGGGAGVRAAADALGRATGTGVTKQAAKNAAAAAMLEQALWGMPGVATKVWGPALALNPLRPEDWGQGGGGPAAGPGGSGGGGLGAAAGGAGRREQLAAQRAEQRELERGRKEEEREQQRRREEERWRERAAGPPHEQMQRQARGAAAGAALMNGGGAAAQILEPSAVLAQMPALQRHLAALARRAPGQAPATALALLNQYAPVALLEVIYKEGQKKAPGRGAAGPVFEATATVRTRLQQTEVVVGVATARAKRDAKQLAAAHALDQLLASNSGVQKVAIGEETGDRRRLASTNKGRSSARPPSVQFARIDYTRPLTTRFQSGGTVAEAPKVEVMAPQRQRWGLGFGPAEAWEEQQELIAPLPEQAAFLGFTKPREARQPEPQLQQMMAGRPAGSAKPAPAFVAAGAGGGGGAPGRERADNGRRRSRSRSRSRSRRSPSRSPSRERDRRRRRRRSRSRSRSRSRDGRAAGREYDLRSPGREGRQGRRSASPDDRWRGS